MGLWAWLPHLDVYVVWALRARDSRTLAKVSGPAHGSHWATFDGSCTDSE